MRPFLALLILMATAVSSIAQDARTDAALRDAQTLIGGMQRFDTDSVASMLYTAPFERMGVPIIQMKQQAAQLDANLKSIGAKYLSFTLGTPTEPFSRPEGLFTLIPYTSVMTANGRTIQQDAFFIAFSDDSGATWKFLDGIGTARGSIETILPNYEGPDLPPIQRIAIP